MTVVLRRGNPPNLRELSPNLKLAAIYFNVIARSLRRGNLDCFPSESEGRNDDRNFQPSLRRASSEFSLPLIASLREDRKNLA